jgi:hypothetical protein
VASTPRARAGGTDEGAPEDDENGIAQEPPGGGGEKPTSQGYR